MLVVMVWVAGQRWIGQDAWLGRNDGGDAALDDTDCTGGEVGHVTFEVGLRLLFAGGAAGLIGLGGFGFGLGFGFSFFFLALGAGLGFEDAEPAAGELAEAVGGARIPLALEHVVGDLFEELAHVVEGLKRDQGRIGRQQGRVFVLAPAVTHESAVSMGCFSFLLLPGVVEETVFLAALGRGITWASLIAGGVAARGVGGTTYFQELWDFHIYSSFDT